jgi:hypothetical protein
MKLTVFYSWQTDLDNRTNRGFVQRALEKAIKSVRTSLPIEKDERPEKSDLVLDKDTKGVAGTPDIAHTIFDKISNAAIFIGDVSIINNHHRHLSEANSIKFRPISNPNVLIELGYAARHLSWENIICVFNTAFGEHNDLPFDLRHRRVLHYDANPSKENLLNERDALANELADAIQAIINIYEAKGKESIITPLNALIEELADNSLLNSDSGGKYYDSHYNRLKELGIFSNLPDLLKQQIREAYAAANSANGWISSSAYQPTYTPGGTEASNKARLAINAAKPKIESAYREVKKFVESLGR